jgi:hypothetical protein
VIPAGYMLKTAIPPPEWFSPESAGRVEEVCSLSNCVVTDFTDAFQTWRHNGWWLYDSPVVIDEVVREQAIETQGMSLFYYELYEQELADDGWRAFEPNGFPIDVVAPKVKTLIGFDVTTHFVLQGPECSPLSCNNMAGELKGRRHGQCGPRDVQHPRGSAASRDEVVALASPRSQGVEVSFGDRR